MTDVSKKNAILIHEMLATQRATQAALPDSLLPQDHVACVLAEIGEFLADVYPLWKDWRKKGEYLMEEMTAQQRAEMFNRAALELADVMILSLRALINSPQAEQLDLLPELLSIEDAALHGLDSEDTLGGLCLRIASSISVADERPIEALSALFYISVLASRMPFGISGLMAAYTRKTTLVRGRTYRV